MNGRAWSGWELLILRELYPSTSTAEIARVLGRGVNGVLGMAHKIGSKKTAEFLRAECRLQKGECVGREFQYAKGHTPANKGTRRPGYAPGRMAETQFKKGVRSGIAAQNWVPIGTVMPDHQGFPHIKVRDKEPFGLGNLEVWPLFHRCIWEHHHGPIPAKHIVTFKDRDRSNCSIENLELITMAENARRNSMWAVLPRELAEVIHLNGQLKRKLRNKENGKEQAGGSARSPVRDARSAQG